MKLKKVNKLLNKCLLATMLLLALQSVAQKASFTHEDTLRGSLNANRDAWNVLHYHITVEPDFTTKSIKGNNSIRFKRTKSKWQPMQIDLQAPMQIDSVRYHHQQLSFAKQSNNTWLIQFSEKPHKTDSVQVFFSGIPKEAVRPPWDGGWIWTKDTKGNPWMSVAVQGLGASAWYPCKDHQSDEPDNGAQLSMIVPDSLTGVGNGKLIATDELPNQKIFHWQVKNPINNYLIVPTIGKYGHFSDTMMGEKGLLNLEFWALEHLLDKAKTQFAQAKPMLRAFEYWFGPYPFYEDDYKIIQTPFLGMEHQSGIAYGNGFRNGYLGRDLSGTGWGLKWDFIIVHESGHEWFANNITTNDIADMWVHEGFTNYSETLFTEYYYGTTAGNEYCKGIRRNIQNDKPIIGEYGVNNEGSGDMYPKAANMIHLIRQGINDTQKFRKMLRHLNHKFYHQTVTTQRIEQEIAKFTPFNVQPIFNQYLRTTQIPELNLQISGQDCTLSMSNCLPDFQLPLVIPVTGKRLIIEAKPQTFRLTVQEAAWLKAENIESTYYVKVKE